MGGGLGGVASWPVGEGGPLLWWISAFLVGSLGLGCYGWYLCRGPRPRGLTTRELEELQLLAAIERDEDPL